MRRASRPPSASSACSRRCSPRPGPAAPTRRRCASSSSARPPRPRRPPAPGRSSTKCRSIPCRVEGHVTGFQATASGVEQPYEAPFDGKVVAWSITLSRPSRKRDRNDRRRGRLLQRPARQPLGGADRHPAPGRRQQAAAVHARPPEPDRDPQPLLRQQGRLRPRPPADGPPGPDRRPHRSHLGADVRLQRLRRKHLARQSQGPSTASKPEDIQGGHPQQGVGKTKTYGCFYSKARLLYTATLVKQP